MDASRRSLLRGLSATTALCLWDAPLKFAFAAVPGDRRLVVVILRGAVDGLAAVPPHGDKDYGSTRGQLALATDGATPLHDLDGMFGLHPALANMKMLYDAKQLIAFQNICSPYRDRSHFEGQNVLETGAAKPHAIGDGWLNRALTPMGLADSGHALAVAQTPPLLLTGPARATSWMPATLPTPDAAFLAQVKLLYAGDPALSRSLGDALALQSAAMIASDDPSDKKMGPGNNANLTPLFAGAGRLLAAEAGPRVAVLDISGWDTHINEGAGEGALARRLAALDGGLDALKTALGPAWNKTAIVMATEFGRTARPNGNGGTDHGTGGASFLLGGAVAGGHVRAEWTGLSTAALQDGRDQPARTDLRSLFKGLLAEHMGVPPSALNGNVFPDSAGAPAMTGLIRA
ncbi:MAG TPA: DUF1501 domain-containing protein [Rhizomicrobium sp.]|nr:DUF1501 domain-containing protein [Rhizomicrobium sp.]